MDQLPEVTPLESPAGQPAPAAGASPEALAPGPLSGVRVVDLSRVLAGPYCAQLLADMGAQVLKVESPGGDENRRWPPFRDDDDVSANYAAVNRGKRGMTLDLKADAAPEILERMVRWADVLIHNFLPDTAARLGIDYERYAAINPRLVFCSLSGYGARGPLRDKQGYDLMLQAFSGAMGLTGHAEGGPVRIGVSYVDMATGITAYGAIVTALLARATSGRGACVRASLLETGVAILGHHVTGWFQGGVVASPQGSAAGNLSPYQAFRCSDGYVVAGATNDRTFAAFCRALGCERLLDDPRFASNALRVDNRAAMNEVLFPVFAGASVGHWVALLDAVGVPTSPVHSVDQVLAHPQVLANDMVLEATTAEGTTMKVAGVPFKIDGMAAGAGRAAPHLAADTELILRDWLGFDAADLARLRASSVNRP